MAIVLFLVFGLIALIWIVGDSKSKQQQSDDYFAAHPQCKFQEEYLLACRYYLGFQFDESRADPVGDAIEAARHEILRQGFTPSHIEGQALSSFASCDYRIRKLPVGYPRSKNDPNGSYVPIVNRASLAAFRDKDKETYGARWIFKDEITWRAYCDRMDDKLQILLEETYTAQRELAQKRPSHIYAKEYLIGCYHYNPTDKWNDEWKYKEHLVISANKTLRRHGFYAVDELPVKYWSFQESPSDDEVLNLVNVDLQQEFFTTDEKNSLRYREEVEELHEVVLFRSKDLDQVLSSQTMPKRPNQGQKRCYTDDLLESPTKIKAPPEPKFKIGPPR